MRNILNFVLVCWGSLLGGLSYTILNPIYPSEALSRNVDVSKASIVMGSGFITSLAVTPFCSQLINVYSAKTTFAAASFVGGFGNILFGCLVYIKHPLLYFWFSLLFRTISSVGEAIVVSSAYPLGLEQFSRDQKKGKIVSTLDALYGIGMVAGPSLGGLLYTYTGFSLPFCSLGLSMVISGLLVAVFCSCKKQNSENTCSECSWKDILVCSGIPDYILALLTIGNVNNWFSASLEQHLYTAFGLVPAESGGIMMIFALLYSLTSPVVGVLLDYGFSTSKLLILGGVSSSLACFLLGPIPGFELLLETVPVCVVSLVLIGAGVASASLCGYLGMLDCARRIGSSEDILNKITCIWLMTLYLGGFLSVIFGGISADVYGFSCSSTIQGCITVIVTIWISCRALYRQMFNTSSAEKDDQLETGEPFL